MKIFHLFSNFKFTGPADPALLLAKSQQDHGADVTFFCGLPNGDQPQHLSSQTKQRGLKCDSELKLSKHFSLSSLIGDIPKLRKKISLQKPDVIHCHLPGDHLLACLARGTTGPRIIKSQYQLEPPNTLRSQFCRRRTDLWISPTSAATEQLIQWGAPSDSLLQLHPPVDLKRFQPRLTKPETEKNSSQIRVGVVARMQRHRRFPELIEAFTIAAAEDSRLHLEILGRGTHQTEVAKSPASMSPYSDRIHFPGYISPEDYPDRLAQFDLLVFLVPGSDGTCRAAREALACGIPVISSRRGLLPELIPSNGGILLKDESPRSISEAILLLAQNTVLRREMGSEAYQFTQLHYRAEDMAQTIENVLKQPLRLS